MFPMMTPSSNQKKLAAQLFSQAEERQHFLQALTSPLAQPPALIWRDDRPPKLPFPVERPFAWQPPFVDRVVFEFRPGRHPLHEEGAYYCLDISSVFTGCVFSAVPTGPPVVIDVCASPGGKCVFVWRMLSPSLVVANEVIGKRSAALIANLQRCRIGPAMVIRADVSRLAERIPACADLVVVDAPCSGQSLAARDKPCPGGFHPATINQNANRQRRILAQAARLVAPGGYLAYLTCTYATKENETNAAWLLKKQTEFLPQAVPLLAAFQSQLADFPCYRLWPHQNMGAGGFAVLLQKDSSGRRTAISPDRLQTIWTSPDF